MAQSKRIDFLPRGLSRTQAAVYVGVSTSLFDQLVTDSRMPPPREINRRRIWDRHQIDALFDELPGGLDNLPNPVHMQRGLDLFLNAGIASDKTPTQNHYDTLHQTYMDALGYDPRGIADDEKEAAEAKRIESWTSAVRASPLWQKEKFALLELLKTRGTWVSGMHIKGAGGSTFERLEVRGYVEMKMAPWHYADTGKPGPREGEHWRLTPEGEAVARQL